MHFAHIWLEIVTLKLLGAANVWRAEIDAAQG